MKKNRLGVEIYNNWVFNNEDTWGVNCISKDENGYPKLYRRRINFELFGLSIIIYKKNTSWKLK